MHCAPTFLTGPWPELVPRCQALSADRICQITWPDIFRQGYQSKRDEIQTVRVARLVALVDVSVVSWLSPGLLHISSH